MRQSGSLVKANLLQEPAQGSTSIESIISLERLYNEQLFQSKYFGDLAEATSILAGDPRSDLLLARLLVYSVMNNFAGRGVFCKVIFLLRKQGSTILLRYLHAMTGVAADAFAENLFRVAVEAKDSALVEALLKRGLDPNRVVFILENLRQTAIERSSRLQDAVVTRLLLAAGADPNKTHEAHTFHSTNGALEHALAGACYGSLQRDLFQALVSAGANVTSRVIAKSLEHRPNESDILLLDILVLGCQDPDYVDWLFGDILCMAIEKLNFDLAATVVKSFLEQLSDFEMGSKRAKRHLSNAVNAAAGKGYTLLVQTLLKHTKIDHQTLYYAVKSGEKSLVQYLLNIGAVAYECRGGCTPYAEAIRSKNDEIKDLLETAGALNGMDAELQYHDSLEDTDSQTKKSKTRFELITNAAVQVKDIALVRRLLETFVRANADGKYLTNALKIAVEHHETEITSMLLDAGADPFYTRPYIALNIALEDEDSILVRKLLEFPGNNDFPRLDTKESGGDLEDADFEAEKTFDLAMDWGNRVVIEHLFNAGGKDHPRLLHLALSDAIRKKNQALVQFLLDFGADINTSLYESTALAEAAFYGDQDILRLLLEHGANPEDADALEATLDHDPSCTKILLDAFKKRFRKRKRLLHGAPALCGALIREDDERIRILLDAKVDVDTFSPMLKLSEHFQIDCSSITPFGMAIKLGETEVLPLFLRASASPDNFVTNFLGTKDCPAHKETALLAAIQTQSLPIVELLLSFGANADRPATHALLRTPLQKAAEIGNLEIVTLLINKGVSVNEAPAYRGGATALQLAAMGGFIVVMCKLLDHGADVHAPASKGPGRTAFQGTAEYGRIDALKVLWNATFGHGFGAAEVERAQALAERNGHHATKAYIEELVQGLENEVRIQIDLTSVPDILP